MRSARPPSGWAWSWCSRPIAATCSRIPGRTARCRFGSTTKTRRSPRSSRGRARRPIDGVARRRRSADVIAARAAEALGLPWHPPAAAAAARNKRARASGCATPGCRCPGSIRRVRRRPIRSIQPVASASLSRASSSRSALSGSRGVMRADDRRRTRRRVDRLRALLRAARRPRGAERRPRHALCRRLHPRARVRGRRADAPTARCSVLAIFDKPDPLDGPFFEETIYVTPSSAPAADAARDRRGRRPRRARQSACVTARSTPSAASTIAGVFVLEVAARPIGGLCARALRCAVESDCESVSRDSSRVASSQVANPDSATRNRPLDAAPAASRARRGRASWRGRARASGVMMIPIPAARDLSRRGRCRRRARGAGRR